MNLRNLSLFISLFILGGSISVALGQDIYFDLLNYHFYNAFALLNWRYDIDIAPAGMYSFFNPVADIPYYLMLKHMVNWPRVVAFLMGLPWAVCAFFTVKIVYVVFNKMFGSLRLYPWTAAAFGLTGIMAVTLAGASSGDLQSGMFVLGALYFLLRDKKIVWLSGFLGGIALGLKFTNGPLVAGLFVAGAYIFWKDKKLFKDGFIFSFCFALGFIAVDGLFMYLWWTKYQNPFFPFFNNIFKSPYFAQISGQDKMFLPDGFFNALLRPFEYLKANRLALGEETRAFSIPLAYAASFFLTAELGIRKIFKKPLPSFNNILKTEKLFVLLLFWVAAMLIWLNMFAILRYAAVLDFLAGIIIVAALARVAAFLKYEIKLFILVLLLIFSLLYAKYPDFGQRKFKSQTITAELPFVPDGALVLLITPPSTLSYSYLVPMLNPRAVYAGGLRYDVDVFREMLLNSPKTDSYTGVNVYYKHNFRALIQEKINSHEGELFIVEQENFTFQNKKQLIVYGLVPQGDCRPLITNFNRLATRLPLLCRASKIPNVTVDPASHKTH